METGQMFMTQMPTMATVAMAATTPTLPMMAEDASGIDFAAVLQSVAPVIAGDNQATAIAENKPVVMQQMPETAVKTALLQAITISVQPEIKLETAAPFSGLPVQAKMSPDAVNVRQANEKSDDLIEKEATDEPAAGLPQEVALNAAGAQLAQALQLSGRMPEPELSEESDSKSQSAVTSSKETSRQAQMQQVREAYSQPVVNKPVSTVTAPEAAPAMLAIEPPTTSDSSGLSEKSAGTEQTVVHVANAVQEAPVRETRGTDSQPVATKTVPTPITAEQSAKPVVASLQAQPLQTIEPKTAEMPQMQTATPNTAAVVETPKSQAVAVPVVETPKLQSAPVTIVAETTVQPVVVEQSKAAAVSAIETSMPVEASKLQSAAAPIVAEITVKPVVVEQPKAAAVPTIETSMPVIEAPKLQAAAVTIVAETTAKPVVVAEQPKVEVQAVAPAPAVEAPKPQPVATAAPVVAVPNLQTAAATVVAETPVQPVVVAEQPKMEVQAVAPAPVVEAPKPHPVATAAPVVEAPKLQAAAATVVTETPVKPVVAALEQTKTAQETQKLPVTQQQFMEAYSKPVAKPAVIARAEAQTVVPPANAVMQRTESVALDTVEPVTKTATLAVVVETAGTNSGVPSSVVKNDVSATVTRETKAGNPQLLTQSDAVVPVTVNLPSEPVQAAEVTIGTKRVAESGAVPVRIATKGGEQGREERSVQQAEPVTSAKSAAGNENLISAALKEPSSVFQEDASTQENPLFDQKMTGHLQHVSPQQNSNSAVSTAVAAIPEQTQPATLSEHVVKQVNERIAAHEIKSGTDQIVLRLSPENMGEVKVNLRMENQKLTVEIVTDNKAVTDALRQNSDSLKETLAKQNIKMESFDVSTGGNSDNLAGRSNRNLNEWQEMARNKQANQWQQGGYSIPETAASKKLAYIPQAEHSVLDIHY